ncbi:hypothetical protein BCR33DRAFT_808982 [Rhizoclosmatium globosum]|uniref:Cryptic loci regulator 2 N-terminal domain-containing protein n=1 Tax=Rhizoclosmatium globosum TaxID=329046 RepID=A0A1Y2CIQ5_9FUNG|nr:hypothetical protein BCR33DRAFT_808982 [Rhizoclosmatium globosum]|eukprot:ORY46909.1 hypothetical protein BCR33DRAFT_808982 [Rhizoclosmatium globosum]
MPTIPTPHTDAVANDVGEYTHFRLPDNSSLCTSNEISAFLGRVSQLVLNHFKKHPENVPSYLSSVSLDERSTFSLPKGYVLVRVPRISSMTNHVDKYIWGHPSGQKFRSTNEFAPHMISLISGSSACECVLCLGKMKRVKPSKANVEHEEVLEEGQAPPAKRRRHESYRVIDSDDDDQESSSVTRQSGSTNSSLNNESQRQGEDEESDFSEVDEMEDVFIQQAAEEMEDDDIQILISDEGDDETESDIADAIDTTFPKPQQAGSTSAAPAFRSSVSIPLSAPFFPSLPQPLMQQRAQHASNIRPPPKPKSVTSATSATAIRRPSNTQPTPKPPTAAEARKPSKPASTDTNEPFKYKYHPHQLAWIRTYLLSDAVPPLVQTPASSSTTPKFIPPSFSHLTNPGNIVYWPCIVRDTMINYIPSTTSDGPVRVIRPHSILSILEEEDDAGGDIEVFAPSIPYTPSTWKTPQKKIHQ